jgi:serine/threonine protein kinase
LWQVYKGRWAGTLVAVKVMSGQDAVQKQQFQQEVELLMQLRHPCIVNYLGHIINDQNEEVLN